MGASTLHSFSFERKTISYRSSLTLKNQYTVCADVLKRYDIIVYKPNGKVQVFWLSAKRQCIPLNQHVFDQIAPYNLQIDSEYLMVTNGHSTCLLQIGLRK